MNLKKIYSALGILEQGLILAAGGELKKGTSDDRFKQNLTRPIILRWI